MDKYIGTKIIQARSMTRLEYNDYRGWQLPDDEDGSDEGFLVEYLDGGAGNHPDHEGYISWSPAGVFERAYQPTNAMNFGHALEMLKMGHKVARAGWNGKGMFLFLNKGSIDHEKSMGDLSHVEGVDRDLFETGDIGTVTRLPNLNMCSATGSTVTGWLASQTDMLAEDWGVVEIHTE